MTDGDFGDSTGDDGGSDAAADDSGYGSGSDDGGASDDWDGGGADGSGDDGGDADASADAGGYSGDAGGASDDGMTMTTDPDTGVVTWKDADGATGSITRAGSTIENPDGSTTAIDAKGNEVHFDADGNYTEELAPGQPAHGAGTSRGAAPRRSPSADPDFRPPQEIREPDWSR